MWPYGVIFQKSCKARVILGKTGKIVGSSISYPLSSPLTSAAFHMQFWTAFFLRCCFHHQLVEGRLIVLEGRGGSFGFLPPGTWPNLIESFRSFLLLSPWMLRCAVLKCSASRTWGLYERRLCIDLPEANSTSCNSDANNTGSCNFKLYSSKASSALASLTAVRHIANS